MELKNELIDNKAQVDESVLLKIIHKAAFSTEKLLLNLLPKNKILVCNGEVFQGICFRKFQGLQQ